MRRSLRWVLIWSVLLWIMPARSWAENQFWHEFWAVSTPSKGTLDVDAAGSLTWLPGEQRFGLFAWYLVSPTWAEGYVGPVWSPKPWVQFGLGAGIEQATKPWRLGAYAWAGDGQLTGTVMGEYGGSGAWWRVEGVWTAADWLGLGALAQSDIGVGPKVEFNAPVPDLPVKLWAVPFYGFAPREAFGIFVGLRFAPKL